MIFCRGTATLYRLCIVHTMKPMGCVPRLATIAKLEPVSPSRVSWTNSFVTPCLTSSTSRHNEVIGYRFGILLPSYKVSFRFGLSWEPEGLDVSAIWGVVKFCEARLSDRFFVGALCRFFGRFSLLYAVKLIMLFVLFERGLRRLPLSLLLLLLPVKSMMFIPCC